MRDVLLGLYSRAASLAGAPVADVADLVTALAEAGYKRETLRKSRTALAQTFDFHDVTPNPARDERVKLPKERRTHLPPPLAEHVERALGARRSPVRRSARDPRRVRPARHGTRDSPCWRPRRGAPRDPRSARRREERALPVPHLPDDLFAALLATLPPREDRDPQAPLFPSVTDANLRMAIARACKAGGVPHFSPHALRRRRGSLHYMRTGSLAEVAELLGDSKRVAADHYVYALVDYREVDRRPALARAFT